MPKSSCMLLWLAPFLLSAAAAEEKTIWLSELDLAAITQGWGKPAKDRAVTGKPLMVAWRSFERGLGTHAPARLEFELDGAALAFHTWLGVDDGAGGRGSIRLRVYDESRRLYDSGVMKGAQPAVAVDVPLKGKRRLVLVITDGGDGMNYDHVDLAEARFAYSGSPPRLVSASTSDAWPILTPKPGPQPRINPPRVYGVRPGRPVVFRLPVTGRRPMRFSARGLPATMHLNATRGLITGTAPTTPGRYEVVFTAVNEAGSDEHAFAFVVGDTIALTPPMGWNHWYAFGHDIDDALFRRAADAMVASGMADVGYAYVSIDDCWMRKPGAKDPLLSGPPRDEQGAILANGRFPDMKALTDYIHAYGLKAGIYTSPGPRTCAGFQGSYQHEQADARRFAEWGFDLLKYDWCSYGRVAGGNKLEHLQKPYRQMGAILRDLPRDIVLNLCQYGRGEVWKWGAEVGGQSWRTAGDLGFHLTSFVDVALRNAEHYQYVHPGAWNDPDYLLLGRRGPSRGGTRFPLTANQQYAYMSLWSLMAAPLFYSGDLARLDEFTINVLCNPEVIEVNQDPLGRGGRVVARDEESFVMVKPLAGGALTIGLFNTTPIDQSLSVRWSDLGLHGPQKVRDLWRQRNLGISAGGFTATVPERGVALLRAEPASH